MNAIQIKERVDFYMDSTRNGRFSFLDYKKGVNDAIEKFITDMFGNKEASTPYGFQENQQIRDNLYTLITTATPAVATGTSVVTEYGDTFIQNLITFPANYHSFVALSTIIEGYTNYAKPMTFNNRGPLFLDSFRKPSNTQVYYNENSTGLSVYRGATGTLTSVALTYIKMPAEYSIGVEANLINEGTGVLVSGTSYIAVETSVHNGVTYNPGTQFISASTNLTSGQVILTANTTTCDLPEKTHEDIAKMAAAIMSGAISDYTRSSFVDKEAKES
jgi:hypothetical protein